MPAGEIERFVVEQVRAVGRDPAVLAGTLRQVRQQNAEALADLAAEQKSLERELARHHAALRKLVTTESQAPDAARLANLNDQIRVAEQKAAGVRERAEGLGREAVVDGGEVAAALSAFEPAWEQLAPREQARVIQLLVDRVEYDGAKGTVSVTFHPTGIKALAKERGHEAAA